MFGEAQLNLERINPLAGNLDQVVGAAAEKMKAVRVAHKAIAGVDPATIADGLGRFIRPVPVQRRVGIAAHPQNAFLVVCDLVALAVLQRDLVTGNAKAGRAELFSLFSVAEIDVEDLGGAQALNDLEPGQPLPPG